MEVRRARGFRPFRDLSLKWSFALYVATCILVALALSVLLSGFFSALQNNIQDYYYEQYRSEIAKQAYVMADGKVIQGDGVWILTEDIRDRFTERDQVLYELYGTLAVIVVPIISILSILAAGIIFYRQKLKKPLLLLDAASARIAAGDLDFKVEYGNRNEFGRLAASFEAMRESLFDANREMWRMVEGRRRLNAAFAHDLGTPLTVLRGYCDFLLKYIPEGKINSEKAVSTLSTMDVYLKRLEGYTSTMSSLQKLEEIELSPKLADYNSICEEISNIAAMLIEDKKVSFHGEGEGAVFVDLPAVSQVCENLISNASRYAKREIMVSCSLENNVLSISVADDGPGFSPEALKNATEPYYRDEKEFSDTSHFGIGLYICRLLCEKHDGALTVENAHGGTVTARFGLSLK